MNYTIRNDEELKFAYTLLRMLGNGISSDFIKIKKAIREYNARPNRNHFVYDSGNGTYIELIDLPEDLQTEEEAYRYLYKHEDKDLYDDGYISWYKVIKRQEHYMAYHTIDY